jgi:hypothetical protein
MRMIRSFQVAVGLLLPFTLSAQVTAGDPPARVGRISSLAGTVSFQAAGSSDWSLATLNYTVTTGDRLFTSERSRAETEVGPFTIRLGDSTDLSLVNLTDHFMQLGLAQGILRVSVYRVEQGDSLEVDTPNGAFIVRSAGQYRIEIPLNGSSTFVSVDQGILEASGPNLEATLHAGQAAELTGTNPIQYATAPRPRDTDFDRWSADRDRRDVASDCSKYVNRDIPGCADLSEQGRWEQNPIYGPVWYPQHVSVGWVPYRYGRWVWVEPWGWTWIEDEPWGFAPFHYGRWVAVGGIWCWAPGPVLYTPYYAPALVVFVGGPRFGFGVNIGAHAWFPLGPREPYFPWYHHGDGYLREVNRANVRNVGSINEFIDARRSIQMVYANRAVATTVVSAETFRNGQSVGRATINARPEDIARAPIANHPWVTPTARAAAGGGPLTRGPVAARPQMVTAGRAQPAAEPTRGAQPSQRPPLVSKNAPPAVERRSTSPTVRQAAPNTAVLSSPNVRPDVRQTGGRTLITRNPPPAQPPSFTAREQAMRQDPGRPLEPQQVENIQRGRSAGPHRDPEVPAHQPAPAAKPSARPAPSRKPPHGR